MFSHMVGSLFILTLFSLAVQKLFIFMRSHLFILSLMSLALGDISGNPSALLVGLQTGATTMENSMEFPQKTKNGSVF